MHHPQWLFNSNSSAFEMPARAEPNRAAVMILMVLLDAWLDAGLADDQYACEHSTVAVVASASWQR